MGGRTGLAVVVYGGGLLRRGVVPPVQPKALVLQAHLGEGLVDVHGGLPGAVARRVPPTPAALVQHACNERRLRLTGRGGHWVWQLHEDTS